MQHAQVTKELFHRGAGDPSICGPDEFRNDFRVAYKDQCPESGHVRRGVVPRDQEQLHVGEGLITRQRSVSDRSGEIGRHVPRELMVFMRDTEYDTNDRRRDR